MMQNPPAADRVLIIRLGAMGDVVRTLPAVATLRGLYPGAHLAWLVETPAAGAVEASGLVDETLVFPRTALVDALREGDALGLTRGARQFLRALRDRRFEVAIDFHGLFKSGLLAWLSGASTRFGYAAPTAREGSALFCNHRVGPLDPALSRFDRNAALVRAIDADAVPAEEPLLAPSPLAQARLAARLRAAGRERSEGFVLIHPGSSAGARYQRYPAAAWARVAQTLAHEGCEVWIASGSDRQERSLAEEIVRRAGGALVLAPETRSFDDLLALQSKSAVFVAADSGPLHAASLSGVPVVQLMGPTDPDRNAPWKGTSSRRLCAPIACSPCQRGCADPACMRVLPPTAVADRVLELVASSSGADARTDPLDVSSSEPRR